MATHSSILTWKIPWTAKPDWLQSMESQRVGYNQSTEQTYNKDQRTCNLIMTMRTIFPETQGFHFCLLDTWEFCLFVLLKTLPRGTWVHIRVKNGYPTKSRNTCTPSLVYFILTPVSVLILVLRGTFFFFFGVLRNWSIGLVETNPADVYSAPHHWAHLTSSRPGRDILQSLGCHAGATGFAALPTPMPAHLTCWTTIPRVSGSTVNKEP